MKYVLLALPAVIIIAAISLSFSKKNIAENIQPNTLTAAEKNDGWISLFDGKTTDGWHTYNEKNPEAHGMLKMALCI